MCIHSSKNDACSSGWQEVFISLASAFRRYKKFLSFCAGRYGLSFGQISILLTMYRFPSLDSAGKIARKLDITKGLASRNVDSLCRKGFLLAVEDRQDKRIVRLTMSQNARQICRQVQRNSRRMYSAAAKGICPRDMETALGVLEKMSANMEKNGNGRNIFF